MTSGVKIATIDVDGLSSYLFVPDWQPTLQSELQALQAEIDELKSVVRNLSADVQPVTDPATDPATSGEG